MEEQSEKKTVAKTWAVQKGLVRKRQFHIREITSNVKFNEIFNLTSNVKFNKIFNLLFKT